MHDLISEALTLSEEAQRRFSMTLHDSVQRWDERKSRQPGLLMKRTQQRSQTSRKRPAKSSARAKRASNTAPAAGTVPPEDLPPPLAPSLLPALPPAGAVLLPSSTAADVLPALKPNNPRGQAKRKRLETRVSAVGALKTVQNVLRQCADTCQELQDDPWQLTANDEGKPVFKRASSPIEVEWAEVTDTPDVDNEELILTFFVHASSPKQRVFGRPSAAYVPFEQSLKSGLHLLHVQAEDDRDPAIN